MEYVDKAYDFIWKDSSWLPDNRTWNELKNKPGEPLYFGEAKDLFAVVPISVVLLIIRITVENGIFRPIGQYFKLRSGTIKRPENVTALHNYYRDHKHRPDFEEIENLATELTWTTRQIERWFRKRRNLDKSSEMKKFCEAGWRFFFYLCIHVYGFYVLYDEDFFYRYNLFAEGWPYHQVKAEFYWYYMIELSFYISLVCTLLNDVRRKDFAEMIIHHMVTIFVMFFSWSANWHRVGMLILFSHDAIDYWLEGAKLAKYIRYERVCNVCFAMFTIIWTITRLYIFPFIIIYKCWTMPFTMDPQMGFSPLMIVTNICLTVLQTLHIFWTIGIYGAVWRAVNTSIKEDYRSESEESSLSEDDRANGKPYTNGIIKSHQNGHNGGLKKEKLF